MRPVPSIRHPSRFFAAILVAVVVLGPARDTCSAQSVTYLASFDGETRDITENGFVLGQAFLPSTAEGTSMYGWVGSPSGQQHRVGLYDAMHTSPLGRWYTLVNGINRNGVSIGSSSIFGDSSLSGNSAWVADASGRTLRIGFYDREHTATWGGTVSHPVDLNEQNQVVGYSNDSGLHQSGWIIGPYMPLTRIGLFDIAHTSQDGKRWSQPHAINDAGFVLGSSRYYNGRNADTFGHTAWLYTPWKSTRVVGFTTGVHRTSTGWHDSHPSRLTNSGYLAGYSRRYRNNARNGTTAWLTHVDGPNRPVGFYDGIHTAPNGVAVSYVELLNENGTAAGHSYQFAGSAPTEFDRVGLTSWVASPSGVTRRVGLYGPAHSRGGFQSNLVKRLDNDGWTAGEAVRFDPSTGSPDSGQGGATVWLADPAGTTVAIEPAGSRFVRADGYRQTRVWGMSATHLWGDVLVYSGMSLVRSTGWIYDRSTGAISVVDTLPSMPAGLATVESLGIDHVYANGAFVGTIFAGARRAVFYEPTSGLRYLSDVDTHPDAVMAHAWYTSDSGYISGDQYAPGEPNNHRSYLAKY